MSQEAANIYQGVTFSRKCVNCGLRNFSRAERCQRCKCDLSQRSAGTKLNKQKGVESGTRPQHRGRVFIFVGALAILFAVVLFYVRQDTARTPEAISEVPAAQPRVSESNAPAPDSAQLETQSQQAATQVLTGLKHFQSATQSNLTFDEYDQMLSELKNNLNSTLPSFISQNPNAQSFRQEVAAAVRDYSAADNWWKTTIRNSSVLNEANRIERLQAEWNSAQVHLDNAEKVMPQ